MYALLVGLPAITVIGIETNDGEAPLLVHIETLTGVVGCEGLLT